MKNAVIIGAGPAGLTAAYRLLKEGDIHPIVLEADDVVGGISRTVVHNGNRIDIGGHRFFSKNREVTALWEELMPRQGKPSRDDLLLGREGILAEGGPDPEKEERVMLSRNRVSRIFHLRKFFDYPISIKASTFINLGLAQTVKAGASYLYSAVRKRPEKSLEDFYINRFGKTLYETFFEDYTEKVWGVHPSRIAPDWGAQRVKGLSLGKILLTLLRQPFGKKHGAVETSLIDTFSYPKKGPGQLWEVMAEEIRRMGGEIIMNAKVRRIQLRDGKLGEITYLHNGREETIEGDTVFSSLAVRDLVAALDGEIPEEVRNVASGLLYRDFITAGLLVKKLRIRNRTKRKTVSDIVPDCWIYIQERDVKIGRLQIFNNWSPYLVADLENTVWIGLEYFCNEGDSMWEMTEEAFIEFAIDELCKIGIIDRKDVLDSVRLRIPKAYPAYFGSYGRFDVVRNYLDSLENLYCIGRNGQHRYNNMDHSMLTAMEAVRSLYRGTPRGTVWEINTEEEYHETAGK